MTEPERAEEFREAIAKMPARSFRINKKRTVSGLAVILAVAAGTIRLSTYEARTHHVNNTAYLQCVAQHETATLGETDAGFPAADPSFGISGTQSAPISDGEALAQASSACAKYPH